jgi:diguanylate cyclase (GGDEF)-like protein
VGVLSLHSSDANGFNADHERIIEAIARQIAHTLKRAAEFDDTSRHDALTGLPNLQQLEQFLGGEGEHPIGRKGSLTLLFIDVVGLKRINIEHGRQVGDDVLRYVVKHAVAGLRMADILFRCGSDEVVAVLSDTSADAARLIGTRIRDSIRAMPFPHDAVGVIPLDIAAIAVSCPADGDSLTALLDAARGQAASTRATAVGQIARP